MLVRQESLHFDVTWLKCVLWPFLFEDSPALGVFAQYGAHGLRRLAIYLYTDLKQSYHSQPGLGDVRDSASYRRKASLILSNQLRSCWAIVSLSSVLESSRNKCFCSAVRLEGVATKTVTR